MFKAKTSTGEIIDIEKAVRGGEYYCPFCNHKMITKMGNIKVHHFAHDKDECCDKWYSENKGPWHRSMQNLFKKEYQEVVLWKNNDKSSGVFHIADICVPRRDGTKLIVEFQHSPMSSDEFDIRNKFYTKECVEAGGKLNTILWVFDFRDKDIFFDKASKEKYYYEFDKPEYVERDYLVLDGIRFNLEDDVKEMMYENFQSELENFNEYYKTFSKCLKLKGWKVSKNPYVFVKDFPESLNFHTDYIDWKRKSKTFLNCYSKPNSNTSKIQILFHLYFQEWSSVKHISYNHFGQEVLDEVKKFTNRSGFPVFARPTFENSDYKKLFVDLISEDTFFNWARKF